MTKLHRSYYVTSFSTTTVGYLHHCRVSIEAPITGVETLICDNTFAILKDLLKVFVHNAKAKIKIIFVYSIITNQCSTSSQ